MLLFHYKDYTIIKISVRIGRLGVVNDVHLIQLNTTTLQLTYTPPFSLLGIPIISFIITITSSNYATNTTINTNTTELLFSPLDICTDYLLEIAAYNKAGKGESYFINKTLYRGLLRVRTSSLL